MNKLYISKTTVLFAVLTILLTLNFSQNFINSVPQSSFINFQMDAESQAVGRLAKSNSDGIFSHGGFLGWINPSIPSEKYTFNLGYDFSIPDGQYMNKFDYQYDLYEKGMSGNYFEGYYSQTGFQCAVYIALSKILNLSGNNSITFLYALNSFLLAIVLMIFAFWVQKMWGTFSVVLFVIFILFSQWLTLFGRNLYWATWAFYIPLLMPLLFLDRVSSKKDYPLDGFFKIVFWSIFIKCLFNGFEFITAALVMSIIPFIFYAFYHNWGWKLSFNRISVASLGAIIATISVLIILVIQISFVKGSIVDGVDHILFSFGKRTYGNPENYSYAYVSSLESSLWSVLKSYWDSIAIGLSHWFAIPKYQQLFKITHGTMIMFYLGISLIVLFSKQIKQNKIFYKKQLALVITLWVSLLAPLSWLVIFKAHSAQHPGQNPIVWQMPFMLFGYVLTASVIWFYLKKIPNLKKLWNKR